ncbi:MAG: non-homologous end-joining DNA ligase [Bacteroidota bacterium]
MSKLLDDIPKDFKSEVKKKNQPDWISPMLATLTDKRFSDKDWIYERKLDGERCLVFKKGKEVNLMSRNKKKLNKIYPELLEALENQKYDFIVDGEIVAFENNKTSFSKLQQRMHDKQKKSGSKIKVFYYIFDILHIDDYAISKMPLKERKKILHKTLKFSDPIRYSAHITEDGKAYFKEACQKGWEGIIAKDALAGYVHSRSKKWLKFKCENRQELVIAGYTEPQGERIGFGALLIGFYKNKKLQYAGKVGTGFSDKVLEELHDKMKKREIDTNPFEQEDINVKNVHWIQPELVGEFKFTEWTNDNRLRHPSFQGLRHDKDAEDVVKEKA